MSGAKLGVWPHEVQQLVQNIGLHAEGMQRRVRNGIPRLSQAGLLTNCSLKKSSRCSEVSKHRRFAHESVCLVGMPVESGKATYRTPGTGGHWHSWLEFQNRAEFCGGCNECNRLFTRCNPS